MASDGGRQFDVLIISDFRLPGGTASSVMEEIKAQAAAGYSTGLLHVPLSGGRRPFNQKIRRCIEDGLAVLMTGSQPVRAKLVLIRHPRVFQTIQPDLPAISSDLQLLIVNQVPSDGSSPDPFYDPATVAANLRIVFGEDPLWMPLGPLVRASLEPFQSVINLADSDWPNIIDRAEWSVPRTEFVSDRPVIGRHSRAHYRKWPNDPETILAAYPESDAYRVKILGGVEPVQRVLGRVPPSWTVYPFNSLSAREFLASIDYYVYYHHHGLTEAFGRGMLEALASGAVVIVPPHFRVQFGDACLYADSPEVIDIVDRFSANKALYDAQSRRGLDAVGARFSFEVHAERVKRLIGPSTSAARPYRICPSLATARVLFVSAHDSQPGHLSRVMAMARRASNQVQPLFLTTSRDNSPIGNAGWPVEYLPSLDASGWDPVFWRHAATQRLDKMIGAFHPRVVVFDGPDLVPAALSARRANPDVRFVWLRSRDPNHQDGVAASGRKPLIDLIVECNDVGLPESPQPPARSLTPIQRLKPMLLLDPKDLLDRADARHRLGMDADQLAALIQLAETRSDLDNDRLDQIVDSLGRVAVAVFVTTNSGNGSARIPEGARAIPEDPVAAHYAAFDFGISTSAYGPFHDALRFGLPTLFLPDRDAPDRHAQQARAATAADAGAGWRVHRQTGTDLSRAIEAMLDGEERTLVAQRGRELVPGNGARAAMKRVESMVGWS